LNPLTLLLLELDAYRKFPTITIRSREQKPLALPLPLVGKGDPGTVPTVPSLLSAKAETRFAAGGCH
jgi:hypothetical protein